MHRVRCHFEFCLVHSVPLINKFKKRFHLVVAVNCSVYYSSPCGRRSWFALPSFDTAWLILFVLDAICFLDNRDRVYTMKPQFLKSSIDACLSHFEIRPILMASPAKALLPVTTSMTQAVLLLRRQAQFGSKGSPDLGPERPIEKFANISSHFYEVGELSGQ